MRRVRDYLKAVVFESGEIAALLAALVEKSLVNLDEASGRYRLLESARQYALDRLLESGDSASVRDRHREYLLGLAETASPNLLGDKGPYWLERLEREHGNLRAALEWCSTEPAGLVAGV